MTRGAPAIMCMAGWLAAAQSPGTLQFQSAGTPQFEVATVKVARELHDGAISIGMRAAHGEITWAGATLADFIRFAYNVKDYQVSGPDWIKADHYDLAAKVDGDASQDQIPMMLRALLAGRFALTLHTASKNMPVYALTVAKGGLKIQEVTADGGTRYTPRKSAILAKQLAMNRLADLLSQRVDRPVIDQTGLGGVYDIELSWSPDLNGSADGSGPSIFTAIQEKLGLKLESRNMPVEVLVIDRANRTPAAN